jgi:hypothetical protein
MQLWQWQRQHLDGRLPWWTGRRRAACKDGVVMSRHSLHACSWTSLSKEMNVVAHFLNVHLVFSVSHPDVICALLDQPREQGYIQGVATTRVMHFK